MVQKALRDLRRILLDAQQEAANLPVMLVGEQVAMRERNLFSYSAANMFPMKILRNEDLILSCLREKRIFPIHVQLNPTNRCNFKCSFCSCGNRDRTLELSKQENLDYMRKFKNLGCKSVTITGGGEPLLHPEINRIIQEIHSLGIQVGLVTNGSLLKKLECKDLVWARISSSDELSHQLGGESSVPLWFRGIADAWIQLRKVDWSFSHVVTPKVDVDTVAMIVKFANYFSFTHVRLVSDILRAEQCSSSLLSLRKQLSKRKIDDSKVIYQPRAQYVRGTNPCYISLLKPVVGADGNLYPCCGTQYALPNPARDYEKSMRMGSISDLDRIYRNQEFFDGSRCVKCYYGDYNRALSIMLNGLAHEEFI